MLGFTSWGYSHSEAASSAPRMIEGSLTCYKLPLFSCTVTQATHAVKHRLPYSELTVSAKGDDLAIQVKITRHPLENRRPLVITANRPEATDFAHCCRGLEVYRIDSCSAQLLHTC